MKLALLSVRRPYAVSVAFLVVLLFGLVALRFLDMDFLPKIEPPVVSVLVPYPGASAEDVEKNVTTYLEDQLSDLGGLSKLKSLSKDNLAVVSCVFEWGTDVDAAAADVRDKVNLAKFDIREHAPDAGEPIVFKFSTSAMPVAFISISARESWERLYHLVDKRIADRIKRLPGVGAVVIYGGLRRQINVEFDPDRLAASGLSVPLIVKRLKEENVDLSSGAIKRGMVQYRVRLAGRYRSPEEIADTIIGRFGGRIIRLRDVAEVRDSFKESRMFAAADGKPAIMMMVQKQTDANTVAVCRALREELRLIQKELPPDVKVDVPMDSSEFITKSLDSLARTLLVAGVLVCLITFLFLGRITASLIVISVIPFSLVAAAVFLFLKGYTINVISLMSLSIAIGMVVDNAIVVLENIARKRKEGMAPVEAAVRGASEVGTAITASTLTTIAVFLPLVFLSGLASIIFDQLALAVVAALLGSLFASLSLTPLLASRLLKSGFGGGRFSGKVDVLLSGLAAAYGRFLSRALMHRGKILLVFFVVFLVSLLPARRIGSELFPDVDTGEVSVMFTLDPSASLAQTKQVCERLYRVMKEKVPEATYLFYYGGETRRGIGVAFGFEEGPNHGRVGMRLVDRRYRRRSSYDIADLMREELSHIPGIESYKVLVSTPAKQMLMGGGKQIEVEVAGYDFGVMRKVADRVKRIFEAVPGAVDVSVSQKKPRQEVRVSVDREKASSLGVDVATVAYVLRSYYYGLKAGRYREGDDEFDIFVRMFPRLRDVPEEISSLPVPSKDVKVGFVRLGDIAEVEVVPGPVEINRKDRRRVIVVGANVSGSSLGAVKEAIARRLQRMKLPRGVNLSFGGEVEEQRKAFSQLRVLLAFGVLLVYMVMVGQFESLLTPFIIAFSIPFAFTGVIWTLYLTGTTLSLMSFIAVIMLMGVVVNNAIVLVDYTNLLRAEGMETLRAVVTAAERRLRPVLMTTLTTIGGMLPLVFMRREGVEMWRPFGLTAAGGLALSAVVTLVVVPLMYAVMGRFVSPKHAAAGGVEGGTDFSPQNRSTEA